jgi:site-specific recombinase XerD
MMRKKNSQKQRKETWPVMGLTGHVITRGDFEMKIQQYLDSLATQTRSKETLRAYKQDLTRFEAFLTEKGLQVLEVRPSNITEYLAYLDANRGRTASGTLAPATITRRLTVVSEYYKWLQRDSDDTVRNPVENVKRPKVQNALIRAVDDDVLASLVDGITDIRDKAIVLLFIYSGLRLSELRMLDKDTMTYPRRVLPTGKTEVYGIGEVVGKGGKRRTFIAGKKAVNAVKDYLRQYRLNDSQQALFLSSRNQRISSRAIQHIVDSWCNRLGISHIHVHALRHSFATRNVNSGMSAAVLQTLLGHASLKTTARYFHMKNERISSEYFSVMEYVRATSPV